MLKTYLVSEEVLKQLLDALEATQPYLHPSCTAQRLVDITENRISNILTYPPAEPAFWMDDYRNMEDTFKPWMQDEIDRGVGWEPLFRKDAP
jgi:hypothetical protein